MLIYISFQYLLPVKFVVEIRLDSSTQNFRFVSSLFGRTMSKSAPIDAGDYGSEFDSESDSERKRKKKRRDEELPRRKHAKHEVASKEVLKDEYAKGEC